MTARITARLETAEVLDRVRDAQHVLGLAMYRIEFPWRYRWLRLTRQYKRIYREQQEMAAFLAGCYGRGPYVEAPKWMR